MLQEAILKGQAMYVKRLTSKKDISSIELIDEKNVMDNKLKGIKLDRAINNFIDPSGKFKI